MVVRRLSSLPHYIIKCLTDDHFCSVHLLILKAEKAKRQYEWISAAMMSPRSVSKTSKKINKVLLCLASPSAKRGWGQWRRHWSNWISQIRDWWCRNSWSTPAPASWKLGIASQSALKRIMTRITLNCGEGNTPFGFLWWVCEYGNERSVQRMLDFTVLEAKEVQIVWHSQTSSPVCSRVTHWEMGGWDSTGLRWWLYLYPGQQCFWPEYQKHPGLDPRLDWVCQR